MIPAAAASGCLITVLGSGRICVGSGGILGRLCKCAAGLLIAVDLHRALSGLYIAVLLLGMISALRLPVLGVTLLLRILRGHLPWRNLLRIGVVRLLRSVRSIPCRHLPGIELRVHRGLYLLLRIALPSPTVLRRDRRLILLRGGRGNGGRLCLH